MVNFRINIVVDSRNAATGITAIERRLAALQRRAGSLSGAFGRLGGILATVFTFKAIQEQIDGYLALENRLAAVTREGENLVQVQENLLRVANRSRTSLQEIGRIYSRLSVGIKTLGISQAELIDFTETLSKTIAISGATSYEAQGALTQFSQAMAAGALRGDELRSVLEQLPEVANVIAKRFGVTAPQLAILGKQGRITAQQIIGAFRDAREEIEKRFSRTVPTIAQSFSILKNEVLVAFGQINKSFSFSSGINKFVVVLAKNLQFLTEQFKLVGRALQEGLGNDTFAGIDRVIQLALTTLAGAFQGAARAVGVFFAVLGKVADTLKGLPLFEFREIIAAIVTVTTTSKLLSASIGSIVAIGRALAGPFVFAREAVNGIAKAWLFVSRNTRIAQALLRGYSATLYTTVGTAIRLGAAIGSWVIAAELYEAALDDSNSVLVRIAAITGSVGLATFGIVQGVQGIYSAYVLAGNAATTLLTRLGGIQGIVASISSTLSNGWVRAFTRIIGYPALILVALQEAFSYVLGLPLTFEDTWEIIKISAEKAFKSIVNGIEIAFKTLANTLATVLLAPFQGLAKGVNALVGAVIGGAAFFISQEQYDNLNDTVAGLEGFLRDFGGREFSLFSEQSLQESKTNLQAALDDAQKKIDALSAAAGKRNVEAETAKFQAERDRILAEMQKASGGDAESVLGADRDIFGQRGAAPPGADIPQALQGLSAQADAYQDILDRLQDIVLVEQVRTKGGDVLAEQVAQQVDLYREQVFLTKEQADELDRTVQLARDAQAVSSLANQLDVQRQYLENERQLNLLLRERPDLIEQINQAFVANKIAMLDAQMTLSAGFERAFLRLGQEAQNYAAVAESAVMTFADRSTEAIATFVETGKLNFKAFASSLLSDIARLIIRLLVLQAIQAAVGLVAPGATFVGAAAAGAAGAGAAGGGGTRARGGTVQPDRSYVVGEKGPEIFKPNTTGTIIPNPGAGGPPPQVNVQVVNVDDPKKVPQAINDGAADEAILNVLQRRRDAVRRTIG